MTNNKAGKAIKVAILDTGVTSLTDLNVEGGVSFVEGITDYSDDNGHGTHVAGTIAALNNTTGVVGTASKAKIYAVKVLDSNGSGSYGQVIQGIDWAIENKMDIISISFGGTKLSQALHEAITEANNKGILIVAAAGNRSIGEETEIYPALFPEVISVGAVDTKFNRSWFSSTGSQIDMVAPGSLILSTLKDGGYGYLSGTSMAVPHVVRAAAILWSENKSLTSEQIKQKLYESATPLGDFREYGHGLVNVAKALGLINGPIFPPVNPLVPEDSMDNVSIPNDGLGDVSIASNLLSFTTSTSSSIDINGSFETDANSNNFPDFWETTWLNGTSTGAFATRTIYDPTNGSYEYRLYNGTGDASSYVFAVSNLILVLPNTTYKAEAMMKYTLAATAYAHFTVIQLDAAGNEVGYNHQQFNNGGWTWHDNANVFVTTANTSNIVIRLAVGGEVSAYLDFDAVSVNFVPTPPTNLSLVSKTATSVNLSWLASNSLGVTGYDVFNGSTKLNSDSISGTSYTVSGLNPSTTYNFNVKAKNNVNITSNASSILTVTSNTSNLIQADAIPTMTSYTTPNGIVSSSSDLGYAGTRAWNAFDDSGDTYDTGGWHAALGQSTGWLAYDFLSPKVIQQYTLKQQPYGAGNSRSPKSWTFEGLMGTSWVQLDSQKNVENWQMGVTKKFSFNNSTAYYKYRINVTANNGDAYLVIGEMEMMEVDITPPTAPSDLITSSKTNNYVTLSWSSSTDNVGVIGYDIYRNSILVGSTDSVTLTTNVTSLSLGTTYNFSVKAKDAVGNVSKSSNILFVTTTPDSPELDDLNTGANTVGYGLTYSAYLGTPTDVDIYKYTSSGNGIEQITMLVPASKNYDIYVYDDNMNPIGACIKNTGLGEEVVIRLPAIPLII